MGTLAAILIEIYWFFGESRGGFVTQLTTVPDQLGARPLSRRADRAWRMAKVSKSQAISVIVWFVRTIPNLVIPNLGRKEFWSCYYETQYPQQKFIYFGIQFQAWNTCRKLKIFFSSEFANLKPYCSQRPFGWVVSIAIGWLCECYYTVALAHLAPAHEIGPNNDGSNAV